MNKIIFTPSPAKLSKYFGVPESTLYKWKNASPMNWRFRMYAYLVERYKKEMK